jgi:flagellar hook protein FlgE
MKIIKFDSYKDGGTAKITTESGVFCFDYRIMSNTKGRLYDGYPKDDNSNLIENSKELETILIESLKNYKDEFNQISIDYLVKSKQNENYV